MKTSKRKKLEAFGKTEPFEPFVNHRGTEIRIGGTYRFAWQRTLAYWHIVGIRDGKALMMTKGNAKSFVGDVEDLIELGRNALYKAKK